MAEIKARELERGLVSLMKVSSNTIKMAKNMLRGYNGSEHQEALMSIPLVRVVIDQRKLTESYIEKLRDPMLMNIEDLMFSDEIPLMTADPSRIITKRNHELAMAHDATILNKFNMWIRKYNEIKQIVLDNVLDENTERARSRVIFRTSTIGVVMPGFPL